MTHGDSTGVPGRILRLIALILFGAVPGTLVGQSPYQGEWTRHHPHFMGHRDKAWIELQASRKVIAIDSIHNRETLPVDLSLKVGRTQNQFDLYLAFSLEGDMTPLDERSLFLVPSGNYSGQRQPYQSNVTLTTDRKQVVNFPLYSALMPGAYTIYGVLVPPGQDPLTPANWIQIASTTFAVRRALSQPIEVSEQGNLYVARDTTFPKPQWLPPGPMVVGPLGTKQGMYVNYQAPARRTQPYPIVYIHG